MHRQSIGSPASKHNHQQQLLQIDGDVDRKRRSSSAVSGSGADEEEIKAEKIARSASARAEKILHLIPLLVLLCFFVLYLRSHDPDFPKIVAVGGSFDRIAASTERLFETTSGRIGDVLAMNGHRSLHELGRRNRKVGPA
ncbi:hypothetical protein QJS04_geneDACA012162 [Acorus gramineus]|uniref:Uncharacterized protein n=1 Tax=Acorus gramineus TaxID=55184 RepID=A0AAV9B8P6_ACOGR|nr:hypothetical protein QJS04_geneDACA012162 [Acorus gramineus]